MAARVYLDWNATAPMRSEAREAVVAALEVGGNPSSIHAEGRAARRLVEQARREVAALVGAEPAHVTFTSGGTEANMMALSPALHDDAGPCGRLLVSAVEHASVRTGGRFAPDQVEELPVDSDGRVDLDTVRQRLAQLASLGIRPLVSVMFANNESGVVQPIRKAAEIVHDAGGLLHVDAVQAAGRIPCDICDVGADLITMSAHKLGGPKGVGALIRRSAEVHLEPLVRGGGQERGYRAGTEDVTAIAGFGAAAAAARDALTADGVRMAALRDRLEAGLLAIAGQTAIFSPTADRLPNTTLFAVPGVKAETAVIALDLAGFAVSSGAACSSGKVAASHVLAAMGVAQELARGAIRVSLGWSTTESEVDQFLGAWRKLVEPLSKGQRSMAA